MLLKKTNWTTGKIWKYKNLPTEPGKLPKKFKDYDIIWKPDLYNWIYMPYRGNEYVMFDINQHS